MTQTDNLAWAIGFAKWPFLKMVSFLEYLVFFGAVFFTELLKCGCRINFCIFLEFQFLSQTDNFAWAIGFTKWTIFKMVSFLEYLAFFRAVFAQNYFNVVEESISACFFEF